MEVFCSKCLVINEEGNTKCINCGNIINISNDLKMNRVTRAGFWYRLLAFMVDLLLIVIVWSIFSFAIIKLFPSLVFKFDEKFIKGIFYIMGIVMMILYNVLMETSSRQATIGKQIFKLTVGDSFNNPLSLTVSICRSVSKLVTCLTLGGGYILILFSEEKQAIHDIMTNTFVFKEL
ncbi:MAG: RDD family protein [Bacilli bacterium]|nr:RDD family protein [Bacilli bacterium]MDD4282624.1 RDD family protein [Bacilli bacterium]MDD4718655.1 RDD family protein [Bacilli bacterium]